MSDTALIVGASRGIGLGLARELRDRGWQVTGTVRDPDATPPLAEAGAAQSSTQTSTHTSTHTSID